MSEVKYLENIKTGRQFVATPALMKRSDMRPIRSLDKPKVDVNTVSEDISDVAADDDSELLEGSTDAVSDADDANTDDTNADGEGTDDSNSIDFSIYSDEDLLAMAKAEPYKLKVSKTMKRETVEAKMIEAMSV